MAIISQISLFDNTEEYDKLGDLERVKLVLDNIPDEELLRKMRRDKGIGGRKGIPLEVCMNIYWSKEVIPHKKMSDMLRELSRNSQLRKVCGIQNDYIPTKDVMSRFTKKLKKHKDDIKEIFYTQRDIIAQIVEDFGKAQGGDGKYLDSYARKENKNKKKDARRDNDAKYGVKEKYYIDKNGNEKIKAEIHFGYRLHVLADVNYELPIDYTVTTANENEGKELDKMLKSRRNKELVERCDSLVADKGYDSGKRITLLEKLNITPIIDKRYQQKEEQEILRTVYYDDMGNVNCYCPYTGKKRAMAYDGYDKARDSLSYKCPMKAYGIDCKGHLSCPVNTKVRIKREINPRVFTTVARDSYKWKRMYNKRTALERINSRLDMGYEYEEHTIRGKDKMEMSINISMSVMMTIALVNYKLGKKDKMRSLVNCA